MKLPDNRSSIALILVMLAILVSPLAGCAPGMEEVRQTLNKALIVRSSAAEADRSGDAFDLVVESEHHQSASENHLAAYRDRTMTNFDGARQDHLAKAKTEADQALALAEQAWEVTQNGPAATPAPVKPAPAEPAPAKVEPVQPKTTSGPPGPVAAREKDSTAPAKAESTKAEPVKATPAKPAAAKKPAPMKMAAGAKTRARAMSPGDATALYKQGLSQYFNRSFAQSRRTLTAFLVRNPDHKLAVNAQYWIGETYYAQGAWAQALAAFHQVLTGYPKGIKRPDAMLKIGLTEERMGRYDQARQSLNRLLAVYPASQPAAKARAALDRIGE